MRTEDAVSRREVSPELVSASSSSWSFVLLGLAVASCHAAIDPCPPGQSDGERAAETSSSVEAGVLFRSVDFLSFWYPQGPVWWRFLVLF